MDQAVTLDPNSLLTLNNAGFVAYLAGDYQRMVEMNQKALDADPNFSPALRDRGLGYERLGRFAEAIASMEKARQIEPNSSVLEMLAGAYAAWGKKAEAQKVLAELHELEGKQYVCAYEVATVHAGLGDKAAALRWLEEGYEERADCMAWAGTDPKLDGMRGDPRFEDLLQRIGLARQRQGAVRK
jgi:tetratricopeptide (TPR) repeat protein